MIPVSMLREHPKLFEQDLKKRGETEKLPWIKDLLSKDKKRVALLQQAQELRAKRNTLSKDINLAKKEGKDVKKVLAEAKKIPENIGKLEEEQKKIEKEMQLKLMQLPNLLHESVPQGKDEEGNVEVGKINKKPTFSFPIKDHQTLMEDLAVVDFERAVKIGGSRFYMMKGLLAELSLALQRYAVDFMLKKGHTLVLPPTMMNRKSYEGVTDLQDFKEVMYNVQPDDHYLIATSEHPLTAMYRDEILSSEDLPIKLVGVSPCFRREVGAHGKSDKGIWRVHQFNKVEQVVLCKPEDSWKIMEALLANAKEFFESLGLHCRIVNICTGDIGTVAAKKYDIEVWMPSVKAYKEVVSCSNCTFYQAARSNIKMKTEKGKDYVHTLNSTCTTDTRPLCALFEQFQQKNGSIAIPKVLQQYVGKKVISKI